MSWFNVRSDLGPVVLCPPIGGIHRDEDIKVNEEVALDTTPVSTMSTKRKVLNFSILAIGIAVVVATVRFVRGRK
jgi:hypothetical protein